MNAPSNAIPLLRAENIVKRFGGILALDHVRLELYGGHVHALMGENGAGKSTLGKIISGVYSSDEGQIFFEERSVKIENTKSAAALGISIVLQEFNLIGDLSVAENLFLNDPAYYSKGLIRYRKMCEDAFSLLNLFNMECVVDPRQKVNTLSIAEMQIVEILKAVKRQSRVLIFDEPTAALTQVEAKQLFRIINDLKTRNVAIVIVSHRIEEIFQVADTVTVLRDGRQVLDRMSLLQINERQLVNAMVGREIVDLYGSRTPVADNDALIVLKACGFSDQRGRVKDVSFSLKKGEILGITGLVGAGRTELIRCVFGADHVNGELYVNGERVSRLNVRSSIANHIAMVPEDRKHEGLLLPISIIRNTTLVKVGYERKFIPDQRTERRLCAELVDRLSIKLADMNMPVESLSGGNQQKVMLAKWLMMEPEILIIDEPTRGIDISAKSEIYAILNHLADMGVSIIMVSSEMPEILGMCDRVLVMRNGRIVKELTRSEASEESIALSAMMGANGKEDII
jgi:ABC-type sugar transport system ATPase subunit